MMLSLGTLPVRDVGTMLLSIFSRGAIVFSPKLLIEEGQVGVAALLCNLINGQGGIAQQIGNGAESLLLNQLLKGKACGTLQQGGQIVGVNVEKGGGGCQGAAHIVGLNIL